MSNSFAPKGFCFSFLLLFWGLLQARSRVSGQFPSPKVGEWILGSRKVRAFSFGSKITDRYVCQVVYDAEFRCAFINVMYRARKASAVSPPPFFIAE